MNNKQKTGQQDCQFGKEIIFKNSNGRFMFDGEEESLRTVDNLEETTLTGIYMAVQLQRLFVNIKLQSEHDKSIRPFTIVEVLFHNIWDYRLDTNYYGSKMIDSEGFQHKGVGYFNGQFLKFVLPGGKTVEASFFAPESELEGHAKTKGWLLFDSLPEGALPYRFVFQFKVYEPGATEGLEKESETLEFIITDYDSKPIEKFIA